MNEKKDKKNKNEKKSLTRSLQPAWSSFKKTDKQQAMLFAEGYKEFLSNCKTERESVAYLEAKAQEKGFVSLHDRLQEMSPLQPGEKVYAVNRGKGILLAVLGQQPLSQGLMLVGAHLDTPRIDLKPNPLYQDESMALFKTHYYGGIKKYQWLTIPLALHGVTFLADGSSREITIGEEADDPVLTITDLLPHLAKEQMEKKMSEAVAGEGLNILAGGLPSASKVEDKNRFKEAILEYLNQQYGMTEVDFHSSEWQAVPAGSARDVGLDRAFLGGYGQDDRVCSYAAAEAIFNLKKEPQKTAMVLLVDKEEIGSEGNTGMQARFFENMIAELAYHSLALNEPTELIIRRCLANSRSLSADVNAGMDPNYGGVLDERNAARLGYGITLAKYTGARGKSGTNDANAEFVAEVRRILEAEGIQWQSGELGKVDQGGGGTIAQFMARYGMEVIDCGVPLLSMHAPFEIAHKADIYLMYRGYEAFLRASLD